MPDFYNILMNIFYIVEGYAKWLWDIVFGRQASRTKERLAFCNQCEHNRHGICEECGCVIKAKVRCTFVEDKDGLSIDGCPLKKW